MVKVSLIFRTGRKHWEARWIDPVTGRKKTRTTGTADRGKAERFAARLETELHGGKIDTRRVLWSEVRNRYTTEVMTFHAPSTQQKTDTSLDSLELLIDPKLAASLNTATIGQWSVKMRALGHSPFTIRGYLGDLRKVLRWAYRQELVAAVPAFDMPRCVGGMKGRPVTTEEFERMLQVVPDVTGEGPAESWRRLLRGLWLSGLRLEEAMQLHWTDDRLLTVDLTDRRPTLRIQERGQKSRKFQHLPITPDFVEFLLAVPERRRRGFVFKPTPFGKSTSRPQVDWVGKVISRFGKKAGVKVTDLKDASAHDLRRAFGFRWARRVPQQVLQELMRHKDIKTTRDFYIGMDAQATAEAVWQWLGNSSGNTGHAQAPAAPKDTSATA